MKSEDCTVEKMVRMEERQKTEDVRKVGTVQLRPVTLDLGPSVLLRRRSSLRSRTSYCGEANSGRTWPMAGAESEEKSCSVGHERLAGKSAQLLLFATRTAPCL